MGFLRVVRIAVASLLIASGLTVVAESDEALAAPASVAPLTAANDWNGDGRADVIVVRADGTLRLYRGNGVGGFNSARTMGAQWSGSDQIRPVGDWDGDGETDIIARVRGANTLWLYPGDGAGGFRESRQIGNGWGIFRQIFAPGDWNGDGNVDIIGQRTDNTMWLYPGNGTGGFGKPSQIPGTWPEYSSFIPTGDFNGDSAPDFIARTTTGALILVRGNGAGGVSGTATVGGGFSAYNATVGVGDFNGDGFPDLLGRRSSDGALVLFRGNGSGSWIPEYPVVGVGWSSIQFSDTIPTVPVGTPRVAVPVSATWATSEVPVANEAAVRYHEPGSAVVIADPDSALIGATLANGLDASMVVKATDGNELAALSAMDGASRADIYLVGGADSFTLDYEEELAADGFIIHKLLDDSPFALSFAIAKAVYPSAETVTIASLASGTGDLSTAAQYAIGRDLPLVVYNGSEDEADLAEASAKYADSVFVTFGNDGEPPAWSSSPAGERTFVDESAALSDRPELDRAIERVQSNAIATTVVISPSDQHFASAQAALISMRNGWVSQVGAPAANFAADSPASLYNSMWGTALRSIHVVGAGLADSNLQGLLTNTNDVPASAATQPFRVERASKTDTGFVLTVAAPAGTTSIQAWDAEGVNVATASTSSSVNFSGELRNLRLVARSASAQLGVADFKTNASEAATIAGVPTVLGTEFLGTTYLRWTSEWATPRVLLRFRTDPSMAEPEGPGEPIGFTCGENASFAVPDTSKQWRYEVHEFTASNQATCSLAATAIPAVSVGGVTFPATVMPGVAGAAVTSESQGASLSILDQAILADVEDGAEYGAMATAALPNVYVRYEAHIQDRYVYTPLDGFHYWRFEGDNRTGYQSGTYRVRATTLVKFSQSTATLDPQMGETVRHTCSWLFGCGQEERDRAGTENVKLQSVSVSARRADIVLRSSAANPLFPASPAIDAAVTMRLRPGGSSFTISHDRMPTHTVMWGMPESEYFIAYSSKSYSLPCLAGWLPGCTVTSRVQI